MGVKQGYKQTEVGVIPEDWCIRTVFEIAGYQKVRFDDGDWIEAEHISNDGYRIVQTGNVGVGKFVDKEVRKYIYESSFEKLKCKELIPGDLLICRLAEPAGRACILPDLGEKKVVTAVDVTIFRPSAIDADRRYLVQYFSTPQWFESVLEQVGGTTHKRISRSALGNIKVPFPNDLDEQRAIASALDDMGALLDGLDRLIAKKYAIKQATMQQLLSGQTRLPGFSGEWEVKRIGEFTDCTAGGTPSTLISSYWGGSIRWMNSGELNLKQVKDVTGRITEEGLRNSSTKMIPVGCVLVGLAGQGKTRGTVAMNLIEICTNQSIAAIFPNRSFVSEYLYYNLDARYDELRDLSSGDGGRGGLNLTLIKSLPVPFPNVDEQAAIAAVLGDMDAEITTLETRRIKIRALNQAMMQELLTGRTRLITPGAKSADEELTQTGGHKANVHFLRSVLAAEIIDQLHDQPTFGHVKFEKMMFLVEHLCEVDTGSTYHRKAAGPYDNRALRSIDSQLQKQQWFEARKQEGRYQYVPLAKRGGHKSYFDRNFSGIVETFEKILSTFKTAKTEQCEIVATLLAAWSDLLREKEAVSDEMIVHEVLHNWHEAKQRISEDRWLAALGWMREKGFVPKGVALP
ncbi:restriction endonuclease subunit S [Alcaligenes faecalis]|uniref:restriction endonuclease subunit S n=1 Tax=Alcaligenes faecalis TaxID=511 RepID=UPI00208E59E4|nr:restriction endonuclease subunit S [Alcaligenes faecalis]USP48540.1 restriction endonuclease subunit S [Alcaligenes faecalis]